MELKTKKKNFSIDEPYGMNIKREKQSVGPFFYEETCENILTTQEDEKISLKLTVRSQNPMNGFIIKRPPVNLKPV